ncbi:MAG: hypothetical protein IPM79_04240 [Polyangiaceae bacterium]|jgi:hypothetical protein|nr:hypothetical protein [Polyangiaceae bacterium]MBK8936867.1 hypothetical protein [Polyangiaceae bacterium]
MRVSSLLSLGLLLALCAPACSDSDDPHAEGGAGGDTTEPSGGEGGLGASGGGGQSGSTGGAGVGGNGGESESGVAPRGAVPGEQPLFDGENEVSTASGEDAVFRLEVGANEHVGFFLRFASGIPGVTLELSRWDGQAAQALAITDGGIGLRTLAAFDASGPRTFWLRVGAQSGFEGTLEVVRTPFADGPTCDDDCDRLLQLPVANDPEVDGYDWRPSTVFRYQFGRRDLLMLLRYAGQQMALAGRAPFIPEDLSQWDSLTPGTDVGAPRHASHQNGKDVDLSLYGSDGLCEWRSYCDAVNSGSGRECLPGSESGFDGRANAELFGAFLQSGRVTMSFLDQELIPHVEDGAAEAADGDTLDPALVPLYSDGVHLQHWPNHDNHIHVRLSEQAYGVQSLEIEPFEAP